MNDKLISVVMANYNTPEQYLRPAIESILKQTYTNFEFIIIDDGSTDDSLSVIESYRDNRIRLVKNEKNLGLIKSLNKGLELSTGEYIARIDSDDISLPERLAVQLAYMQEHPNVIVSGTGIEYIGDWEKKTNKKIVVTPIPERERYRVLLLFDHQPNIYHTSVMFNKSLLLQYGLRYDEDKIHAEDYKMWISCVEAADCANVPQVLARYRVHDSSVSLSKREIIKATVRRIHQEQLDKLHLTFTDESYAAYRTFRHSRTPYQIKAKKWIKKLLRANKKYQVYDQQTMKAVLADKWTKLTYNWMKATRNPFRIIRILLSVPPSGYYQFFRIWRREYRQRHTDTE